VEAVIPWLADALALLGLVVLSISVYGIIRLPDIKVQLHAAGKAAILGVLPIVVASTLDSDPPSLLKAVLVSGFLILTSPLVAHEIGRAAHAEDLGEGSPIQEDH
jgi:multicomponent Na+:H+ antiporter subunit G